MGFIDWIHEPNAEARGQYYDKVSLADPSPPPRPTFPCPYCKSVLRTREDLLRHTRVNHPLDLPLLLFSGRQIGTEEVIRSVVSQVEIDLVSCSGIEIAIGAADYTPVTEFAMKELVGSMTDGFVRLRLTNNRGSDSARACREHKVSFRVASTAALSAIEECFIQTMQDLPISVASAEVFWNKCSELRINEACGEYANALSNYIIGMAIKQEHPGLSHLPFGRFKDKLMEALGVFRHLDLPFTCGLAGVVRFNLNDFGDWRAEAKSFPDLRDAGTFFNSPGVALDAPLKLRRSALGPSLKCPVDDLTERIVEATILILEGQAGTSAVKSLLPSLLEWNPLSEYDRQKIHVLMAAMHVRQGSLKEAAPHFRILRSDLNFGSWAEESFS